MSNNTIPLKNANTKDEASHLPGTPTPGTPTIAELRDRVSMRKLQKKKSEPGKKHRSK